MPAPISVPTTLVIATRNAHKAAEIRAILSHGLEIRTLNDFPGAPAVIEDAPTFAGNAAKKALELARWLLQTGALNAAMPRGKVLVLADDSGLEVDALGGAPGVHSARFAALDNDSAAALKSGNSSDAANNAKLLRPLDNVPSEQRGARFRCVLALVEAAPAGIERPPEMFDGVCEGRIGFSPHGQGGFGYDPLFVPTGFEQSFAELGETVKNRISHRAKALNKLRDWLS
jgi:XTP/dITP diphosphohydrolase